MHIILNLILALLPTAFAVPSLTPRAFALKQLSTNFQATEECQLPDPGQNCAGAVLRDVIVYEKVGNKTHLDMYVGAAVAAGGKIAEVHDGGFSGFVPDQVLRLIEAHGTPEGLTVHRNACIGIPWCGEAPC